MQVIGVESEGANTMEQSLRGGHRVTLDLDGTFCEGASVREVAEEPFRVCNELADDIVVVNDDEVTSALPRGSDAGPHTGGARPAGLREHQAVFR